ncbi:MAG: hypothetical protein IJV32_05075 [Bacteroidales bacterium]|nr:hypothetical protein [Bacteroidales bacterium]
MKKFEPKTLAAAVCLLALFACSKEEAVETKEEIRNPVPEKVTIGATLAGELTKVSLTDQGSGSGIALAWEAGDQLRVVATAGGSGSEVFDIDAGFTATNASFTGTSVTGSAFTVFYPGTYADVAAINARGYAAQTQIGNGSADHLEWNAMATGLASYSTVDLSAKQNGAIRFKLQLPDAFTKVYSLTLSAPSDIFSATNAGDVLTDELVLTLKDDASTPGVTLSSDKVLTAYMMVSWNDNNIPEGTTLTVKVQGDQEEPWTKNWNVGSGGYTIAGGKVTAIQLNNANWDEPLFWGGNGTAGDPYIIKNAYNLRNVKTVMDAYPTTGLYFRMEADVDLEDAVWSQVNQVSPHTPYTIHFDGNGHSISNFSIASNSMGLSSFFGELSGEVSNLTFNSGTIASGGSNGSAGILAGIANALTVTNVDANNVDISITGNPGETTGIGGLVGYAICSTFSGCDLDGCDLTFSSSSLTANNVGGIVGRFRDAASTISACTVKNASITAYRFGGGILGKCVTTSGDPSITDCDVTDVTVSLIGTCTESYFGAGGIVGGEANSTLDDKFSIEGCNFSGSVTAPAFVGGIAGFTHRKVLISHCTSAGDISATAEEGELTAYDSFKFSHAGGIVGYPTDTATRVEYCDATANVTGAAPGAGGIAGRNKGGVIDHCTYNTGTVTAPARAAGISASNTGAAGTITNCDVLSGATIAGTGDITGGILGRNHNAGTRIEGCTVAATISGTSNVGGIVALCPNTSMQIINCSAAATITATGNRVGGIVGGAESAGSNAITISSCKSTSSISSSLASGDVFLGGLVGAMGRGTIEKSYSTSTITTKRTKIGGLVGSAYYGDCTIDQCYYNGTMNPINQSGALVGHVASSRTLTVTNSYTAGSYTVTAGGYGSGMVGYVQGSLTMQDSYTRLGTIRVGTNGSNAQGGLIGGSDNTTTVWNVSRCLVWAETINFSAVNTTTTDGVVAGQVHSGASTASTSFANCWYRNDLSYTVGYSRTPGDDADIDTGGKQHYDGKRAAAGVSCSDKAGEIGWSTAIWDFTGDYPALKNVVE